MRLDDDVYLNFDNLRQWLTRLDPNKPRIIGTAGLGRDGDDFVPGTMTYCMGGPGVIFSREAIRNIRPFLQTCLKSEILTEHEDIELGRCLYQHLALTCTNAWDTPEIFWNNYRPRPLKTGASSSWDNLDVAQMKESVLNHAVTMHSNKFLPHQQKTRFGK